MKLSKTLYLVVHYLAIGLHQRFSIEGGFPIQHFIHTDTQRPPITLRAIFALAILHGLQDFRRDVIWGANCHRGLHLKDNAGHYQYQDGGYQLYMEAERLLSHNEIILPETM